MATFTSNKYDGRYLQLTISETQNPKDNTSTLNWTLTSTGGNSTYYQVSETTVIIDGTQVYHKGHTEWSDRVFPAKAGSVSGSLVVKHNTDGTKKVNVVFKTSVYRAIIEDYGGSYDLTTIDRNPPTVTFSVSNITTNGFKISATASTKCNQWWYSVDNGGSWTRFSTSDATSVTTTVEGLSVNTSYNVKVRGRRTYNDVDGYSSATSVKTLGHAFVNSCADFYADADAVTLSPNVTVYEASFTEKVLVKNGSTTLFTLGPFSWSAGTSNRAIRLTAAQRETLLKAMPKSSLTLTLVVQTYSGSTLIGESKLENVTANTSNTNSRPAWEYPYISWWDDNELCSDVTGDGTIMIQGHSHLMVRAIGVTAINNATLSTYTVTIGDKTVQSASDIIDVGVIDTDGALTMKLTVTDSRGHSETVTTTVIVLKYEPPKISKITLRRANGIDDMIQLSFTANMSVITPDGNNDVNDVVEAFYHYKLTSEDDDLANYSQPTPIEVVRSSTGTSLSFQTNQLLSLDNDYSYDFRLVVKDRVSSSVTYYVIPKGIPAMAIRKDKVGINNPDPQYALDVNGDINFSGRLLRNGVDLLYPVGSIYMSVNDTDPGMIFGGEWEPIQDRFLLAAGSTYDAGTTGGSATHTLTISEMPSHVHIMKVATDTSTAFDAALRASGVKAYSSQQEETPEDNITVSGGNDAHNNMPPYLAVYMWKRTK